MMLTARFSCTMSRVLERPFDGWARDAKKRELNREVKTRMLESMFFVLRLILFSGPEGPEPHWEVWGRRALL